LIHFIPLDCWLVLYIISSLNRHSVDDCFVPVYVFLGNPKVLVEMMNTMHALQMFDNGEYMVITVDMETYSDREAYKYLWRKCPNHLNAVPHQASVLEHMPSMFPPFSSCII
jgi:hypothetical protein